MTDESDSMNDEAIDMSVAALPETEEMIENEFADDEEGLDSDSEDVESLGGDLSPNDIFGLDPLDVLTLDELADYLKVSPAAVRRAIKEQNLPGRNIGGEWRFLRDAVANWLRGQEAPAVQQQQAREAYSQPKPKYTPSQGESASQYSRPPRRPYQSDQSGGGYQSGGGGGYRSGQRYTEGRSSSGYRGRDQYTPGGSGEAFGDQASGEESFEGGYEARPPRRPFRSYENRGQGNSREGTGYSGGGGYGGGGGGGYGAGGNAYAGGPKRKNKRRVFEKERGRRMDRRKDNDASEGQD